MKKIFFVLAVVTFLNSCGDSINNREKHNDTDSASLTNPTAIDTMKHPSGVDNSSVISTDTAAMNVQNSIKKADSISQLKKK